VRRLARLVVIGAALVVATTLISVAMATNDGDEE